MLAACAPPPVLEPAAMAANEAALLVCTRSTLVEHGVIPARQPGVADLPTIEVAYRAPSAHLAATLCTEHRLAPLLTTDRPQHHGLCNEHLADWVHGEWHVVRDVRPLSGGTTFATLQPTTSAPSVQPDGARSHRIDYLRATVWPVTEADELLQHAHWQLLAQLCRVPWIVPPCLHGSAMVTVAGRPNQPARTVLFGVEVNTTDSIGLCVSTCCLYCGALHCQCAAQIRDITGRPAVERPLCTGSPWRPNTRLGNQLVVAVAAVRSMTRRGLGSNTSAWQVSSMLQPDASVYVHDVPSGAWFVLPLGRVRVRLSLRGAPSALADDMAWLCAHLQCTRMALTVHEWALLVLQQHRLSAPPDALAQERCLVVHLNSDDVAGDPPFDTGAGPAPAEVQDDMSPTARIVAWGQTV